MVTEWALKDLYQEMFYARIELEGTILKPNMVISGTKNDNRAGVEEVAEMTIRVLKNCVPAAVPGICFLSSGQSDLDATAHLSAMNEGYTTPWGLSFSYGRALQHAALNAWRGEASNVEAAQAAFRHRAHMNSLAALGKWSEAAEAE